MQRRLNFVIPCGLFLAAALACDEPETGSVAVAEGSAPDASVDVHPLAIPAPPPADTATAKPNAQAAKSAAPPPPAPPVVVSGAEASDSATSEGEAPNAPDKATQVPKTPYDLPVGTKEASEETKELASFEYDKRGQHLAAFRGRLRNLKARVDTARDEIKKASKEAAITKMVEAADAAFEDYEDSLNEKAHTQLAETVDKKLKALAQAVRPFESVTGKVDAKPGAIPSL